MVQCSYVTRVKIEIIFNLVKSIGQVNIKINS